MRWHAKQKQTEVLDEVDGSAGFPWGMAPFWADSLPGDYLKGNFSSCGPLKKLPFPVGQL